MIIITTIIIIIVVVMAIEMNLACWIERGLNWSCAA